MSFFVKQKTFEELHEEFAKSIFERPPVVINNNTKTGLATIEPPMQMIPAINMAHLCMQDMRNVFAFAPSLKEDEKASIQIITSITSSTYGTETHNFTIQFEPMRTLMISDRKRS